MFSYIYISFLLQVPERQLPAPAYADMFMTKDDASDDDIDDVLQKILSPD